MSCRRVDPGSMCPSLASTRADSPHVKEADGAGAVSTVEEPGVVEDFTVGNSLYRLYYLRAVKD